MAQLNTSDDLLICCACGAEYDVTEEEGKESCRICDVHLFLPFSPRKARPASLTRNKDPRQYVPQSGQKFTTLKKLREEGHKNVFERTEKDDKVWEIWTEPKVFLLSLCRSTMSSHPYHRTVPDTTPRSLLLRSLIKSLVRHRPIRPPNPDPQWQRPLGPRRLPRQRHHQQDQLPRRPRIRRHLPPAFLHYLGRLVRHLQLPRLRLRRRQRMDEPPIPPACDPQTPHRGTNRVVARPNSAHLRRPLPRLPRPQRPPT
jgi:hypothetical protein